MKFSEYVEEFGPIGRVYLPTASYYEMMEWSLPYKSGVKFEKIKKELEHSGKFEEYSQFFRGGFFRNFFSKYPESNNMHKKMLSLSQKISTLKKGKNSLEREKLLLEAEKYLYKAQCNCAYWHGVFGGLYLPNLRHAIYENLIRGENILQILQRGDKKFTELSITDFDKDGAEEVILSNPYLNVYLAPAVGGSIFEIDYKPKEFNLMNILSRREEVYHQKIVDEEKNHHHSDHSGATKSIHDALVLKEKGMGKYLSYDKARKLSLVDKFFKKGIEKLEIKSTESEWGSNEKYDFFPTKKSDEVKISFSKAGVVEGKKIKLSKSVSLLSGQSKIFIEHEIFNHSQEALEVEFAVEFNVTLLAGNSPDRYYKIEGVDLSDNRLNSDGVVYQILSLKLIDEWKSFSVSFEADCKFDFIRSPIETVSLSEGGAERIYQGSSLLFIWSLNVLPNSSWKNGFNVSFEN